jgi:hypothetical protein
MDAEKLRAYHRAVFNEQTARCVALTPGGHWLLSGGFRVRPLTARDIAILDMAAPALIRENATLTEADYAVLLWHVQTPAPRIRLFDTWRKSYFGWRVARALALTDLASDIGAYLAAQTQDLGGGKAGGETRKEYVAASVALAVRAAGDSDPTPLLDTPLITLGQVLKMREASKGAPMFNRSDSLLSAALTQ